LPNGSKKWSRDVVEKVEAICYGAATIINAMATGKGAAFGVDLWTKAEVRLTHEPGVIEGTILSDPDESPILIKETITAIFDHFGVEHEYGAVAKTWSNFPIARGLKSSSGAANALALATVATLKERLDDITVIKLGVSAAIAAKVTVTGAFDDACASYFGGVVITDNEKRKILDDFTLAEEDLVVLFHVPKQKVHTISIDGARTRVVADLVKTAFKEALRRNVWSALTLNGLIFSSALGYDSWRAFDALLAGAVAAGLSGKGPTVTAIVPRDKIESVKTAWQKYDGEILQAHINHQKAKVVR
jgi:shikimate kinase